MDNVPETVKILSWKYYPQWLAAFGVFLLLGQIGALIGWSSPFLSRLTTSEGPLALTLSQASWVASLLNVGRFVGAILGAVSGNYLGSKMAIIHSLVPIAIGWVMILLADRPLMLYLARIFGGLGLGMAFSTFPLYVGEVAVPQIRGAIITMAFFGQAIGNVIVSLVGYYMSMSESSIVFLVPCLLNILLFMWLPNSPHHLVKVGKLEKAQEAIHWYRHGEHVNEELANVQKFVSTSSSQSFMDNLREFKNPPIRKALIIVVMLYIFRQICGLNTVWFYMEIIFIKAKVDVIHPSVAVILVISISAATALATFKMMDKYGRRPLMIVSVSGVAIAMTALGIHFKLKDLGYDPYNFQSLPIASITLFVISYVLGLNPVPSAVVSEILPANVKCIAACLATLGGSVSAFGAAKVYQPLIFAIGPNYVFYLHAAIAASVVPFVIYVMPETKGKSLHQIQDELMHNKANV